MYKSYCLVLLLALYLFSGCSEASERNTGAPSDSTAAAALDGGETSSVSKNASSENTIEGSDENTSEAGNQEGTRQPDDLLKGMQEMTKSDKTKPEQEPSTTSSKANSTTDNASSRGEQSQNNTDANTSSPQGTSKEESAASTTRSTATNTSSKPKNSSAPVPQGLSHDTWDQLLRKHVSSSGKVNYSGFQRDKQQLAAYLEHLAQHPPQNWSRNKEMAYWINLYNAATVQLIVQHYPVESITKLDNGKPWDVRRVRSGPRMYTLNQIEKDKLLKQFGEPRVHFAVNCAAASCPPLLNKAWTEANIERYFESQTKGFINNERYNRIQSRKLELSKIFDWYKSDFNGVVDFVQRYAKESVKDNARISYLEYDWSLND